MLLRFLIYVIRSWILEMSSLKLAAFYQEYNRNLIFLGEKIKLLLLWKGTVSWSAKLLICGLHSVWATRKNRSPHGP